MLLTPIFQFHISISENIRSYYSNHGGSVSVYVSFPVGKGKTSTLGSTYD